MGIKPRPLNLESNALSTRPHAPTVHVILSQCPHKYCPVLLHVLSCQIGLIECCSMMPGLSKDIQCHEWAYSVRSLQIIKSSIRPQVKWAVNLMIVDGLFVLNIVYFILHKKGLGRAKMPCYSRLSQMITLVFLMSLCG